MVSGGDTESGIGILAALPLVVLADLQVLRSVGEP
jgi:hypothetical protein